MNHGMKFSKRCLALLLAAVLIATNFSGLAPQVRADEDHSQTVSVGQIVANNYDLTEAEKELLGSGLLAGGEVTFTEPTDSNLITLDTENKTVTVKNYEDEQGNVWVPTAAYIYVGDLRAETLTLENGTGSYNYADNAFSVKVSYTLHRTVDVALQENLLGAPANLKTALSNMKDAYNGTDANLGTIVLAMDVLGQLADGLSMDFGGWSMSAQLDAAAIAAVEALEAEIAANDGKLALQVMNEAFAVRTSDTKFICEQGAAYGEVLQNALNNLRAISEDPLMNNQLLDGYLQNNDSANYTKWVAMKSILNSTVTVLEGAIEHENFPWQIDVFAEGLTDAQFLTLDALLADVTETTEVEVINPLTVATSVVTLNMSMFDVTVKVQLNVVDENNEVVTYATKEVVLTLAEGLSAEEILAEVAAKGIEAEALAQWAQVYVAEHYEVTTSTLPDSLTADTTYTITYSPKNYTVSTDYNGEQVLPYGYKLALPMHADPAKAYDYTVNGAYYAQGAIYVVTGNTQITRAEGKAYTADSLLNIIANNYGSGKVSAILKSGALVGNEAVNVRYPDATNNSLLTLENGTLTAESYASSYNGLVWTPYTFGANGNENTFSGNSAAFSGKSVKVIYRLALSNYSASEVKEWLDLAVALSEEANGQITALERLLAYYDVMGQLDKTKLGALNGVIDVTDLHSDAAKNEELKSYFKGIVSNIINECLDTDGKLKIYNMIAEYQAEGLLYYYQNSAAFLEQLELVSGYLNGLLIDNEKIAGLTALVSAAGFPEYAEKIQNVGNALAEMQASLIAPNSAIDLTSADLDDLVAALLMEGDASYETSGTLYLYSDVLTAVDESQRKVQLFVNGTVVDTLVFDNGYTLAAEDVAALQAALDAYVEALYGANVKFYNVESNMELSALVGLQLDTNTNVEFTYTAKEFTVKIDGEADQIITIEDLKVNLPKAEGRIQYKYTIDGVEYTTSTYTFTAEQLDRLFVDGTYTIVRTVVDMGAEMLQNIVNQLNEQMGAGSVVLKKDNAGAFVGMEVTVEAADMMNFIMGLTQYAYVGMNGEGLMYVNEENTLEICLQTVINALLCDNTFGSETIIALGENGGGKLMKTTLQLAMDASDIIYDLDLVINLASVPSQMGTVAEALKAARSYLKFYSNNGVMEFEVNLPDQVYGAYLVALIATGNIDKSDANAINQQIAFQFMLDYFDAVLDSGTDMTTLQNTLDMLGVNLSVEQYNKYFEAFINAREGELFTYVADMTGLTVALDIPGQAAISRVLSLIGFGGDDLNTYLGMVKENKEGGRIEASAHATMSQGREYCAILLDVQASGLSNKYECIRTESDFRTLYKELSNIAGYATIILLDDVNIDLDIAGTTLLDLNGKNVNGTITGLGNLIIVDSSMDTMNAGTVNAVEGNCTIIAGNYLNPVDESYLLDGYYMDGTTVRNAVYHIECDENGNTTFVVNTDFYKDENINGYLPDVRALAMDMVIDLVLNYSTTAGLAINGNTIYDVQFADLLDLLVNRSGEKIIDMLLATVDAQGFSAVVNTIMADLLDFGAIYEGLASNNGLVATYTTTLAPWSVCIERTEGDYLTLSIRANAALAKTSTVSLRLEGNSANYLKNLAYALSGIVEQDKTHVTIDITQPNYDNRELTIIAHGDAFLSVDMSNNEDYAVILAVILAYAHEDKAADVAAAINAGDINALKAVVDNTTVAELFTALKVMNRNLTFAEMAEAVGITVDVDSAADLENVYHLILVSAGKVLEVLDITGMNKKLGNLYDEETGYYVLDKSVIVRSGEINYRGYSALYDLSVGDLVFQLKLFGDHVCEFGDWIEVVPATCTEAGLKQRVCGECGEVETAVIPALGHSFTNYVSNGDATCSTDGTETAWCDRGCGESHTRTEEGSALGHSFTNYVSNGDAWCETNGTETAECDHGCGETDTREIPDSALGHDYVVTEQVDPADGNDGYVVYTCSRCGHSYTDTLLPETGDFIIGGIAALMVAGGAGCGILIAKRKKENEEEEA